MLEEAWFRSQRLIFRLVMPTEGTRLLRRLRRRCGFSLPRVIGGHQEIEGRRYIQRAQVAHRKAAGDHEAFHRPPNRVIVVEVKFGNSWHPRYCTRSSSIAAHWNDEDSTKAK